MFPYIGNYKISKKESIQNLNPLGLGKLLIHNNGKITITKKRKDSFLFYKPPLSLFLSKSWPTPSLGIWAGYGPGRLCTSTNWFITYYNFYKVSKSEMFVRKKRNKRKINWNTNNIHDKYLKKYYYVVYFSCFFWHSQLFFSPCYLF